jgi:hypothetical protein
MNDQLQRKPGQKDNDDHSVETNSLPHSEVRQDHYSMCRHCYTVSITCTLLSTHTSHTLIDHQRPMHVTVKKQPIKSTVAFTVFPQPFLHSPPCLQFYQILVKAYFLYIFLLLSLIFLCLIVHFIQNICLNI